MFNIVKKQMFTTCCDTGSILAKVETQDGLRHKSTYGKNWYCASKTFTSEGSYKLLLIYTAEDG